jgi:hypothetical protein
LYTYILILNSLEGQLHGTNFVQDPSL